MKKINVETLKWIVGLVSLFWLLGELLKREQPLLLATLIVAAGFLTSYLIEVDKKRLKKLFGYGWVFYTPIIMSILTLLATFLLFGTWGVIGVSLAILLNFISEGIKIIKRIKGPHPLDVGGEEILPNRHIHQVDGRTMFNWSQIDKETLHGEGYIKGFDYSEGEIKSKNVIID